MTRQHRAWVYLRTDQWAPHEPSTWHPVLDGGGCLTERTFFPTVARVLDFPPYFGANWAALNECLADLFDLRDGGIGSAFGGRPGRSEQRVRLVVHSPELVLRDEPQRALATLISVFREVSQHCSGSPTPRAAFDLTVIAAGHREPDLTRWLLAGLTTADIAFGQ